MKKFTGKIGRYRQLNKRQRSKAYLRWKREMDRMNRQMIEAYKKDGYSLERNIVEKHKIKKGGKFRDEVYRDDFLADAPYYHIN